MFEIIKTKLFGKGDSKQTAKNRLQMVLVQDRSGLSTEEMDLFRRDIVDVISRYFTVDKKSLEIEWQRSEMATALIINTPVVGRLREKVKVAVAAS